MTKGETFRGAIPSALMTLSAAVSVSPDVPAGEERLEPSAIKIMRYEYPLLFVHLLSIANILEPGRPSG